MQCCSFNTHLQSHSSGIKGKIEENYLLNVLFFSIYESIIRFKKVQNGNFKSAIDLCHHLKHLNKILTQEIIYTIYISV